MNFIQILFPGNEIYSFYITKEAFYTRNSFSLGYSTRRNGGFTHHTISFNRKYQESLKYTSLDRLVHESMTMTYTYLRIHLGRTKSKISNFSGQKFPFFQVKNFNLSPDRHLL